MERKFKHPTLGSSAVNYAVTDMDPSHQSCTEKGEIAVFDFMQRCAAHAGLNIRHAS